MKKTYILLALLLGTLALNSCQDGDWDKEINTEYTIWNKNIVEDPSKQISINELKAKYYDYINPQNKFAQIEDDLQLKGRVICTDDGGNLTQQIVLQDGTPDNPGFLIIGVNQDALYNHIMPGQEILFNLKDIYIGGYGANGQLGFPSKNAKGVERIGRMSMQNFWSHTKFIGEPDQTLIDTLDYNDVKNLNKDQWAGCIVKVTGTLKPDDDARWYLAPHEDADTGNGVTIKIHINGGTETLDLRTSTYADFAMYPIVKDQMYTLYGMLGRYTNSWQLSLRTMSDIQPVQ